MSLLMKDTAQRAFHRFPHASRPILVSRREGAVKAGCRPHVGVQGTSGHPGLADRRDDGAEGPSWSSAVERGAGARSGGARQRRGRPEGRPLGLLTRCARQIGDPVAYGPDAGPGSPCGLLPAAYGDGSNSMIFGGSMPYENTGVPVVGFTAASWGNCRSVGASPYTLCQPLPSRAAILKPR